MAVHHPRSIQTDAVQGRNEQQKELYFAVLRLSSAVSDDVMRRQQIQSNKPCFLAGICDG